MTRRSALALLSVALFAATVLTYSNHFDNEFHFDDSHVIVENTYVRNLGNIPSFFTEATAGSALPTNSGYRPLLMTTFTIDYWLAGGLNPFMFHLTGLSIHLAVAVLMSFLFKKIMDTVAVHPANAFVAILMAGWFSLHTANAETVNYISARSDSLSTLLVLAALVIFTHVGGRRRHLAYLPLAAGILVKESATMFVPILLLYELFFVESVGLRSLFRRKNWPAVARVLRRVAPATIVAAACFGLVLARTSGTSDTGGGAVWSYLITQPFVLLRYFWTFFLPIELSADTDWALLTTIADWRFVLGSVFIVGALALAVVTSERKSARPIAFGVLWFFVALVPTSSFVPFAEVTNDHRMYFPFVGLTLAVGWALAFWAIRNEAALRRAKGAPALIALCVALVLGTNAYGTWQRNQVWDTEETLWLDVTVKSPGNGRGLMNYGLTQMALGRYDVALDYFERARTTPYGNHPYLFINLAIAEEGLGHLDAVEAYYLAALDRGPSYPSSHYFYARWLVQQGRLDEARSHVEDALRLSPGYESALALRAEIDRLMQGGDGGPTRESLLNLSLQYYNAGSYEESIRAAEQALALDPQYSLAYNNICAANNALGRYEQAVVACRAALEIDPDYELAQNNLEWALTQLAASGG